MGGKNGIVLTPLYQNITFWKFNSLLLKPWPIEFVDLPINKDGDFP